MKAFLFLTITLIATAVFANNCETQELILAPSKDAATACSDLRAWGPATLKACSADEAELTVATGGAYDMKPNTQAWVSKTAFDDEESGTTTTELFTLNLLEKTYDAHEMVTDKRGHTLSHTVCSGKVQLKN